MRAASPSCCSPLPLAAARSACYSSRRAIRRCCCRILRRPRRLAFRFNSLLETYQRFWRYTLRILSSVTCLRNRLSRSSYDSPDRSVTVANCPSPHFRKGPEAAAAVGGCRGYWAQFTNCLQGRRTQTTKAAPLMSAGAGSSLSLALALSPWSLDPPHGGLNRISRTPCADVLLH